MIWVNFVSSKLKICSDCGIFVSKYPKPGQVSRLTRNRKSWRF
ncbi:hypothetical protein Hanom_Chr17g01532861 [Helianthus anomalus]